MIQFDPENHLLLMDEAHKRRIFEDPELAEFMRRVREEPYYAGSRNPAARMEVFDVEIPDWPPVPRSPLQMMFGIGGDATDPFAEKPWEGVHPAVKLDFWEKRAVRALAQEMVPLDEDLTPYRLSYQWQCSVFDPARHVVIRDWLRANDLDIVVWWRKFYPTVKGELEIVDCTNPAILEEKRRGSYSPTRRCFRNDQMDVARRMFEFLGRPPAEDAYRPPAPIPERAPKAPPRPKPAPEPKRRVPSVINIELSGWRGDSRGLHGQGALHPLVRTQGRNKGVILSIRWSTLWVFSNSDLSGSRVTINGKAFGVGPINRDSRDKWKGHGKHNLSLTHGEVRALRNMDFSEPQEPKPTPKPTPDPTPTPKPEEPPNRQGTHSRVDVAKGARVYTPTEVSYALRATLRRGFRFFSGIPTDSKIVGITKEAMLAFLSSDPTNKLRYVKDGAGRNFDCENFSELVRCNLQRLHGINGCGVIAGDVHAWNFFVVVKGSSPGIIFVEPQTDTIVESLTGQYAVRKRCEILL